MKTPRKERPTIIELCSCPMCGGRPYAEDTEYSSREENYTRVEQYFEIGCSRCRSPRVCVRHDRAKWRDAVSEWNRNSVGAANHRVGYVTVEEREMRRLMYDGPLCNRPFTLYESFIDWTAQQYVKKLEAVLMAELYAPPLQKKRPLSPS